ncbi:MAG TPA: hypothetical protein VJ877_04850, partial [Bacteroidales bacterium]|nr:hypothetical protein [Bacteroidales bacterium]
MKRILLVLFLVFPAMVYGQKKALDHSVYDKWERLSSSNVSDDGKYVSYEINPQEGDGILFLYETRSGDKNSFERGNGATFSAGNDYFVYQIKPEYELTQQAKRDKKKPDQMPKNDMGIKILGKDDVRIIERVKSFKLPDKEGDWMALLKEKALPEKDEKAEDGEEENKEKAKEKKKKKTKQKGTELLIINPLSGAEYSYKNVLDYAPADKGTALAYVSVTTDTTKTDTYTVSVFDTGAESSEEIFSGEGELTGLKVY